MQPDSPTHSTASTNDYYGDLDELLMSPPRDLQHVISITNSEENKKGKDSLSIYSTYPLSGMHKHKKQHRSIFDNNNLLGTSNQHRTKEEGFEGVGEGSDHDETTSVCSNYSTPDKRYCFHAIYSKLINNSKRN